ncbi:MAG: hypothetical protein AAGA25_10955 [Planctomycetota bacterium]
MQTLELECPACSELLELDMGFAGGVCRCSACGTLMTVPQDAAQGAQAEQLSRPDRPDDPSGMSGLGDAADTAPTPARRERSSSPRRKKGKRGKPDRRGRKKSPQSTRPPARAGQAIEQGVYTTASGKTIKIDRTTSVPVARTRRTGVRIATMVVFFSIIGAVVLIGVFAIVWMLKNPKGGPAEDPAANAPVVEIDPTQFVYNKSENPYTLDQPNAIGLPLTGTVAIILETGPDNADWNETMAEMIGTGLSRPGSEAKVIILAAGPDGLRAFRDQPTPPAVATPQALIEFIKDGGGAGTGEIREAIQDALGLTPDTLILVVGQAPRTDVSQWEQLLQDHPDTALHGVLVEGYSQAFEDMVYDRNDGHYINLVTDDLITWRDEWQAQRDGGSE